ncbi:hypothetical protein [Oscillatoria sp. CS-180]|uniref:hypothetical protein n=1 Tax=Oscillatoria sp. CS-180 TaxID=3021720 RepID=UPI00232FC37A|nr:hypothetical protein [Oscillatoria sp. CS-180]
MARWSTDKNFGCHQQCLIQQRQAIVRQSRRVAFCPGGCDRAAWRRILKVCEDKQHGGDAL